MSRAAVRGCLLGGALGDALGAPVEFSTLAEIRARWGPEGIADMDEAYGTVGAVTDDTQLTLFTAEGLLRAGDDPVASLHHAYLRWLETQRFVVPATADAPPRGWLVDEPAVRHRRGPGMTTVSALGSGERGRRTRPVNDSKGCGGIMRIAPVGLLADSDAEAFELGCDAAALTHGHPSGWLAAGAMARLVALIVEGAPLDDAVDAVLDGLDGREEADECAHALRAAMSAAEVREPSAETVESLGAGWVADETLAIAVYCALAAGDDFAAGVRLAVNHSGDSDSTGAVAGNLLGALLGEDALPAAWLDDLEARELVSRVADDVADARAGGQPDRDRYPTP